MNAPWNPNKRSGGLAPRDVFTAFVCDGAFGDLVAAAAAELGWAADKVHGGGLDHAVQTLSVTTGPQVLLVDLSDCADPLNDINALADVCEPGTVVIAAGIANDVRLYRDLLSSGIHDYLLKPVETDHLRETLRAAHTAALGSKSAVGAADKPRKAVTVIGARGGVGASSIAASLAWMFAERAGRSTALLDLDIQFGTGALAFDLEPGRGLTDALENPSRIDGLFIERAMVRASDRLAVLSAEASISHPLHIDSSALDHLQDEMKNAFECVVVDLPRSLAVQTPHLVSEAEVVLVITDQTLAGTRDTIRLLGWLKAEASGAKIYIVSNRVSTSPAPEVSRRDFEASIERKIDVVVPLDSRMAISAATQGKCLAAAAKGTRTGPAFDQIMALVAGGADDGIPVPASASLLEKLNLRSLFASKAKVAGT